MTDLLIIGRGTSVRTEPWPDGMDVMCVSSGIYAVPPEKRHRITHFATLDAPKYFMHGLHGPDVDASWENDANAEAWEFWLEPRITCHVQDTRIVPSRYRSLPEEIWGVIPPKAMGAFQRELCRNLHLFGFQPTWADCRHVRGWRYEFFGLDCPLIDFSAGNHPLVRGNINNSMFFAVQVAHRLGYDRLHFLGCDFHGDDNAYASLLILLSDWYWMAVEQGKEWINLSPISRLATAFAQENGHGNAEDDTSTADPSMRAEPARV